MRAIQEVRPAAATIELDFAALAELPATMRALADELAGKGGYVTIRMILTLQTHVTTVSTVGAAN